MKVTHIIFGIMCSAGLLACNQSGQQATPAQDSISTSSSTTDQNAVSETVYTDSTGKEVLKIQSQEGDKLAVTDLSSGKNYTLANAESASGAKYENTDGIYFWSKGDEATFGQKDSTIYTDLKVKK